MSKPNKISIKNRDIAEKNAIKRMLKNGRNYNYIKAIYPSYQTADITKVAGEMIEEDRLEIIKQREINAELKALKE